MNNFTNIGKDTWCNLSAPVGEPNIIYKVWIEERPTRTAYAYAVIADKTNDNGWRDFDILKFFTSRADAEAYLEQLIDKLNKEDLQ